MTRLAGFCLEFNHEDAVLRENTGPVDSWYSYAMNSDPKAPGKLASIRRALIEIGFIIFLFYSNLLMGEFTKANSPGKSLSFAVHDIFTFTNFEIAVFSGLIGYIVFEYLRKQV